MCTAGEPKDKSMPHIDQSGKKFGRWTLLKRVPHKRRPHYLCLCDCGTRRVVCFRILLTGESKSCGCYRIEATARRNTKHGMYYSREYRIWTGMNSRCINCKEPTYSRYGGRGITVCDRWSRNNPNGFQNFLRDMGKCPSNNHSIDRIDNDGDYEKSNCRWATSKIQSWNKRCNVTYTYKGKICTLQQISKDLGVSYKSLYDRLRKRNYDLEKTVSSYLSTPYVKRGSK